MMEDESGEIDIIPDMTKIPEREEPFLLPETILGRIDSCLMVRSFVVKGNQ
jgi:hypothetical protein